MHSSCSHLLARLRAAASPKDALFLQSFFKTGVGQYGEGDVFIGVRVPVLRKLAAGAVDLPLAEVEKMLHSKIHEERLLALLLWVRQFQKGDEARQGLIVERYLANTRWVNNWDLVDQSTYHILGAWLLNRPRTILKRLVRSKLMWDRRIAVVSTYALIKNGYFAEILSLSAMLLQDPEDLMHKACGWMLREVGKRDQQVLCRFLDEHVSLMPRTMLRYAIERFSEARRKRYLSR
jgi:3-methyladenine DNA glycosylase AlkD